MSGTRFTVHLGEMSATVDDLDAYDKTLQAHLDRLEELVAHLHTVWTGEAADAHTRAHEDWKDGAAEMQDAVRRMRRALATAHANYSGAQDANVTMWSQFA